MTDVTSWLASLDFLNDDQRAVLRQHDLDSPAALSPLNATQIAAATGLTLGKAARLLTAAGTPAPAAAMPTSVVVQVADPPDLATRKARALEAAAADPTQASVLLEMGIEQVVVGTADQPASAAINLSATRNMLAHAAAGAPVGSLWAGLRVISVRELVAPRIFCNPRTGRPLQDGRDEVSLVPWAELGRDGLRLAAYGYTRDVFEGRAEQHVFEQVRDDAALRRRLTTMATADKLDLATFDSRVVWQPGRPRDTAPEKPESPLRNGQPANPWQKLESLLLKCFTADELRRFLRYQPGGEDLVAGLPSPTSPAALASSAVDMLRRTGRVDRSLRQALKAERPRWADMIDAVFDVLGV